MYLVSELDKSVRVFTLDGVYNGSRCALYVVNDLIITLTQRLSTLGATLNRTVPNNDNLAAEVALSYDGRFA